MTLLKDAGTHWEVECPACDGTGTIECVPCTRCDSGGTIPATDLHVALNELEGALDLIGQDREAARSSLYVAMDAIADAQIYLCDRCRERLEMHAGERYRATKNPAVLRCQQAAEVSHG